MACEEDPSLVITLCSGISITTNIKHVEVDKAVLAFYAFLNG